MNSPLHKIVPFNKPFLIVFFIILLFCQAISQEIDLSIDEKNWVNSQTTLKVANELDWPPFDFAEDGVPMGYSIDLIKLIGEKTGLQFEFVNGYTWAQIMDKFNADEIDILPAFYMTEERKKFIAYTDTYASNPSILITHIDKTEISDLESLKGKKVAVIAGYATAQALEKRYPEIEMVYVKDALEGINAVSLSKVDGFIESVGTISYLINKQFIPNIEVIGDVGLKDPEETQLYIGVKKDRTVLRNILQKGLESISQDEMNVIRQKWIPLGVHESEKSDGISNMVWKIGGVIFIIVVIIFVLIRFLIRRFIKEEIALQFGSRRFQIKTYITLGIIALIVAGLAWSSIVYIQDKFEESLQTQLENDLRSAQGRINLWLSQQKKQLELLGKNPHVVSMVTRLLTGEVSSNYPELTRELDNYLGKDRYLNYSIVDMNSKTIFSTQPTSINKINPAANGHPALIRKVYQGNVIFIPPILSKNVLDKIPEKDESVTLMYLAFPIENEKGEIIAAVLKQINLFMGLSEILQLSHVGETGESYVFDRNGRMLSKSRFESDLFDAGLFQKDNTGAMYIEVRDPGGNLMTGYSPDIERSQQPLTLMANSAINGNAGINVESYRDYRGINVIGAWKWIEEMEIGLATEIDTEEAYSLFKFIRNLAAVVMIVTLVLLIGAIIFTLTLGERANKALVISRDKLEERVIERTEELNAANQQIQGIVDSLADAMIIINEHGIIESFSPSAEKMFQYNGKEIIGLNISNLMPSPHRENHGSYLERYINTGEAKIIGKEREVNAVRKDGDIFPARLMISEVLTGNKRLFVGLIGDLTDRKKAEKQLRTQSAAMDSAANGIAITTVDGTIEYINPAFTKLTGYTLDEAIGKKPNILLSGRQDEAYYENMWATILSGKVWHEEIVNKRKNGELYSEEQTITPVFGDEGQITNFVAIKQDITERKRMEAIVIKAKERMEKELNVAKEIQMSMLPLIFPAFPKRKEIDVYAKLIPAREVGGDFYDFYFIDESHFCFVVGDVSGKGVPAALMMAVTKTLLKSRASHDKSTASILTHVNNEIAKDNDAYMFITIFMAILDTGTGEFVYTNAGHNPSFILSPDKDEIIKLSVLHGPVVGAIEEITYKETKLRLSKDDVVFAYTDGVTEAQNTDNELFSDARLESLLKTWNMKTPGRLVDAVVEEVNKYEEGSEQADDITVLAVRFNENPNAFDTDIISVNIANKLEEISQVVERFRAFGESFNVPKPTIQKFNIVFDELLSNIISYAYDNDKDHQIEIIIQLRGEQIVITITDDGIPFNPFATDMPDIKQSIKERSIGGLGIHIVKNLMDEYTYKRDVNNNIITLIKHNINS